MDEKKLADLKLAIDGTYPDDIPEAIECRDHAQALVDNAEGRLSLTDDEIRDHYIAFAWLDAIVFQRSDERFARRLEWLKAEERGNMFGASEEPSGPPS